MRLIDANALLDAFCNTCYPDEIRKTIYFGNDCHRMAIFFDKKIKELITNAPSVDTVEVKHGHWAEKVDHVSGYSALQCSVCGERFGKIAWPGKYNFCPNCSADMRGDGNG